MLFNTMLFNITRPNILAIAAHPDDIELGCGGFIRRLVLECRAHVRFLILTPGLEHEEQGREFDRESRVKEARQAARVLGVSEDNVDVLPFKDCGLHLHLHEIIKQIEQRLIARSSGAGYHLVLTHARADMHSDHRATWDAALAATRGFDGTVLLYQSVSTIPNGFRPTYFVSLDEATIAVKQQALDCHASQREKDFMQPVRTEGLARGWAIFHRHPDAYFEAFEVFKSYWWD
jgi:LmbE family N-acetylglucosaminyl deacetylase